MSIRLRERLIIWVWRNSRLVKYQLQSMPNNFNWCRLTSMFPLKISTTSYTNTANSSIWSPASIDSFSLDQHRSWCASTQSGVLSSNNSSTNCYNNYSYYTNMDYLSSSTMGHSQFGVSFSHIVSLFLILKYLIAYYFI